MLHEDNAAVELGGETHAEAANKVNQSQSQSAVREPGLLSRIAESMQAVNPGSDLQEAFDNHRNALNSQVLPVCEAVPDPRDGMTIVTATRSDPVNNRVPTVLQAIRLFGEGLQAEGSVPLRMVFAEWGTGLNEEDKRSISSAAAAAGIPVSFAPVSPAHRSAGHSFNEALKAIDGYPDGIQQWVMKFDDDSIAPRDLPRRLAHAIKTTGADMCGGWDIRTEPSDDLSDREQVLRLLDQQERRVRAVPDSKRFDDLWSGLSTNGKFDLAKLYATYSFGLTDKDPISPNENGLVMSPRIVNRLTSQVGQLFIPNVPSGEGAILFALMATADVGKIVIDRKSFVLDRPAGGLDQEYTWGRGDAELAIMLKRGGILRDGMTIADVNPESGNVELINVPSEKFGVVVYPGILRALRSFADSSPDILAAGLDLKQRQRIDDGIRGLGEWLPEIEKACRDQNRTVDHVFASSAPDYTELQPDAIRAMLSHIAGGVAALHQYNENDLIVVRGSL